MSTRKSFVTLMNQIARESARNQRIAEQQRIRFQKQQAQAAKESYLFKIKQETELAHIQQEIGKHQYLNEKEKQKLIAQVQKETQQRYIAARQDDSASRNKEIDLQITEIKTILQQTLLKNNVIHFDSLLINEEFHPLQYPPKVIEPCYEPKIENYTKAVKPLTFFEKLVPGSEDKYRKALQKATQDFEKAKNQFIEFEKWRATEKERLNNLYEQEKQAFEQKKQQLNMEAKELERQYFEGDPNAITAYYSMVLERSQYPEEFPQEFRIAYVPESRELVIDYELPDLKIIPSIEETKYVKTKDLIEEKSRKPAEVKEIYQDIVASVCLRTIHEVLEADQGKHLEVVVFNGFVQTIDPATGKDIRPYLISIRTTKQTFGEIDLSKIDKKACLRNLGAQVSPKAAEMMPVKPIIEFDMVDKRFVEESDILSDLESRPNLMELNPFEFENLVSNLFTRMGLETKQTRSVKDGGVDAVAFDQRPILGGKVIIQAKRYKNTVGVAAVRDLYGTMMNEGANKGILVATSGYGPDAYEFAKDKPIELVDGGGLLYLLDQVGVKARIIFPEDNN